MTIDCPACKARYALPERLLGAAGARVRCPRCGERFVVARGPSAADPREAAADATTLEKALGELDAAGLTDAHARGTLFAEHGAVLLAAFDAYRAAGGEAADFRAGLARRAGIRLTSSD